MTHYTDLKNIKHLTKRWNSTFRRKDRRMALKPNLQRGGTVPSAEWPGWYENQTYKEVELSLEQEGQDRVKTKLTKRWNCPFSRKARMQSKPNLQRGGTVP